MEIQIKTILCPVDFSELSKKALDYGVALAKNFGSKVIILHVIEPFMTNTYVTFDPGLGAQIIETMEHKAKQLLAELAQQVGQTKVETKIIQGNTADEIVDEAKKSKVDLIVMGTSGLSGITHFLIGSNAEKVVRKAPCAVLTVKQREHDFA